MSALSPVCEILVVDDDEGIREAIQSALEDEGYTALTAANGREALDAARARPPSAILLDLMMPVMNGWEFVEEARRDATLGAIPICILSAYADRAPKGVAAVLRKPIELEWLFRVVSELCR